MNPFDFIRNKTSELTKEYPEVTFTIFEDIYSDALVVEVIPVHLYKNDTDFQKGLLDIIKEFENGYSHSLVFTIDAIHYHRLVLLEKVRGTTNDFIPLPQNIELGDFIISFGNIESLEETMITKEKERLLQTSSEITLSDHFAEAA